MLSWDTVWVEISGPEHPSLPDEGKHPLLYGGEVLVEVSHTVSKRLLVTLYANDS